MSAIDEVIKALETQLKNVLTLFFSADKYTQECLLLKSAYYAFKPILEKLNFHWCPSDADLSLYLESLPQKADFDKVSEEKNVSKIESDRNIQRIVDPRCNII